MPREKYTPAQLKSARSVVDQEEAIQAERERRAAERERRAAEREIRDQRNQEVRYLAEKAQQKAQWKDLVRRVKDPYEKEYFLLRIALVGLGLIAFLSFSAWQKEENARFDANVTAYCSVPPNGNPLLLRQYEMTCDPATRLPLPRCLSNGETFGINICKDNFDD
jgi:hypothetical protein